MESWSMNENINGYFKVSKKDLGNDIQVDYKLM